MRSAVGLSSVLLATVFPWRSAAVNLLVYNTNDSGAGSLRQAIEDNRALGGGNTIAFSNVVTGTITLTTGELLITNDVTILGPGANVLAVNGNAASSVFHISNYFSYVTAFIAGLTITNALTTTGFGGGILYESGGSTLTVSNCTVTGNTSVFGGGIGNYSGGSSSGAPGNATLRVVGSTVSGNSATSSGGGIFNYAPYSPATLTVIASTLSSNSARYGGGIYNYGFTNATVTVLASTLSGNWVTVGVEGGGIYNAGRYSSLVIGDTILKAGVSGPNLFNDFEAFISSLGFNLSSDDGGGFLTALGDRTNTEPMLGPLLDNGGPTPTMMPLPGSPAIDQGTNLAGLSTDQRGRCRTYDDPNIPNAPGGDGTDIGAVEINPAHTTIVGTTNDNGISLRWCGCDAQPGDVITFAPSVTGTATLTAGELLIPNKNVTILGPGVKALTISGAGNSRVLHVANSTATISGLTIANGSVLSTVGGGIYNDNSTLVVSNCAMTGNLASNGGGIYNKAESASATLTMIACSVSGNQAMSLGGGIYNDGEAGFATLRVTNCTLFGNSSFEGGGIYNDGAGGGGATVYLLASTLSGNFGTTYQGNSIYNYGGFASVEIGDTILDYTNSAPNIYNNGTVTSDGYNLSGANDTSVLTAMTDQNGTAPMLGPLQDNGGPTQTMAPLPGSPAIDQGKSFGLTTDQRGLPRTYDNPAIANAIGGDGSDIGAVEIQSAESYPIFVTNTNDSGAGSLRQALSDAYPGSSVLFGSNVIGTITLTNGELVIGKDVAILGPGANVLAISGNNSSRVLDITNAFASISGLTIRNGTVLGFTGRPGQTVSGGGIYCEQAATLAMSDCVISNCAAVGGHGANVFISGNGGNGGNGIGGGIRNDGKLTLDRCLVVNNQALGGSGGSGGSGQGGNGGIGIGGGIANYAGYSPGVILHGCTLSGNRATFGSGGGGGTAGANGTAWAAGLYDYWVAALINCTIASNVVNGAGAGLGGGIYCDASHTVLLSCTVAGNNADSSGGGMYIQGTPAGVTNAIIADNTAANAPDMRGLLTSGGYNLIGNTNGSSGFGATGDLLNVGPLLGALQDNGGPTPTMALLAGSPAIDQGNSFGLTSDQRGAVRPFDFPSILNAPGGDGSDIGAFEVGQPWLSIQAIGNAAVLSWPDYYGNFSLETNSSLTAPAGWADAPGTPAVIGTQYFLTNSPISGNRFFRLKAN